MYLEGRFCHVNVGICTLVVEAVMSVLVHTCTLVVDALVCQCWYMYLGG